VWRCRYAELAPPAQYEPTWVTRMVSEDQTHWIRKRFTRLFGKAVELLIRGPEDLECAQQIVRCLAASMLVALGKDVRGSALVAQWRKWWWPTKAKLKRHRTDLNRARKTVQFAQTAASSDRVSDIVEDPDWLPVPRADWREDAAYSRKCPPFLRPANVARLEAIAVLRKQADEAVQSAKPQTPQELERCIGPAFSEYAEHVFNQMAEVKLSTSRARSRLPKGYVGWLRSKCLPAVVDDVCKPLFGQFMITVRYIAEKIGEVNWPEDIARMRRALWKTYADEVVPSSFTRNLEIRLSSTLMEERIPYWEAKSMEKAAQDGTPSASARGGKPADPVAEPRADGGDCNHDAEADPSSPDKGNLDILRGTDGEFKRAVTIDAARRLVASAGAPSKRQSKKEHSGLKECDRRILVETLIEYFPPEKMRTDSN